jgi:hypothetical protein
MKVSIALAGAILLGGVTLVLDARAGAKEDAVLALTASTYAGYAACVGAGLTGNEIGVCLSTHSQCFGTNNELRKMFCAVGVGCPPPPSRTPQQLVRVVPYGGGCIAIWTGNIYWSPDCQNIGGGGNTVNAWDVPDPDWRYIQSMVINHGCVITAFSGGGIYS